MTACPPLPVPCAAPARQAVTVEPKKAVTFTLEFNPRAAGAFSHELALRVKANPFEQHRIALTGECVQARRARGAGRARLPGSSPAAAVPLSLRNHCTPT